MSYDVEAVRRDFPALEQDVVYLDSAATAQRPQAVIDAVSRFYQRDNANVHRGVHALAERATAAFEAARVRVQHFLNAARPAEIVFVRGVTEAVNLVAQSFGRMRVKAGDEVLVTAMEHHSNLVPWQVLCKEQGATLRVAGVDDDGALRLDEVERALGPRTRLFAVTHVSNVLGTVNPVGRLVELAHARGVPVLVDGAQAAPHLPVDVQALGCDFYAFSGHKAFGPMGIGALYANSPLFEEMPPWQTGGEMVQTVTLERATYQPPPHKFEAGTPNVAGAIGLHAALDWIDAHRGAREHEQALLSHALAVLREVPGLRLLGSATNRLGLLSFTLEGIHPHDVASVLDQEGIAVRAGWMCAQPLLARLCGQPAVRASIAPYTTRAEIDALASALRKARETFR